MNRLKPQFVVVDECTVGSTELIGKFENRSQLAHLHNRKTFEQQYDYACSLMPVSGASTTIHA